VFQLECGGRTEKIATGWLVFLPGGWVAEPNTRSELGILSIMSTPTARFLRVSLYKSGGETWQISRLMALLNVRGMK
jgi:hypothetical protein